MGIDLWSLFVIAISYLGLLFLIAHCADAGYISRKVVDHPVVYTLSLGVYATSWTYYGSVGLAAQSGFAFLTIYLGVTAAFLLGPYILRPILRLCRDYQLASIADLFAFRYGGRASGFIVTVFMLIGILPYISLQIRAVTESTQIITRQAPSNLLALSFCLLITIFAVLFGARHLTPREKHAGLVAAIAFESAVKLIALCVAGTFAVTQVFGGFGGMNEWVDANPEALSKLYAQTDTGLWTTLLLLSFSAAFLLPRQYHMTFVENEKPQSLNTAYWLFPLYLLVLNLPIIPILWAGQHLSLSTSPDFYVLGITLTLGQNWFSVLTFIGGVSAASAMMIVTTLALSYMCLNHLFLPASISATRPATNLYKRILWGKRVIIAAIIAAGYGFYIVIELNEGLASLGLISFVAAIQLLPGLLALLFWTRATQTGFIAGLLGGASVWFCLLILPLLVPPTAQITEWLNDFQAFINTDIWSLSTFCTLSVNSTLLIAGSLLTRQSKEEQEASLACISDALQPLSGNVTATSINQFVTELEQVLGNDVAVQEVERALGELDLDHDTRHPDELRLLHARLERNLSGLLGPTVARLILRGSLQLSGASDIALTESLGFMERRLETSRQELRGVTRELDDLRRYLRNVLQELPLGVCSVGPGQDILIWNSAMQRISGVDESTALKGSLRALPAPWNNLLTDFAGSDDNHRFKQRVDIDGRLASCNFHKSDIAALVPSTQQLSGKVILVEDRTHLDTLESELAHSERLASVGRLAAGVAHEIGNPLTGIASLAQNLEYDNEPAAVQESADDILSQVERINGIVRSLLTFSRSGEILGQERDVVSLHASIMEAIRLVKLADAARAIDISLELDPAHHVHANQQHIIQIFVNLLNNACDASVHGTPVHVYARVAADKIIISVEDQGAGISEQNRSRVFDPFFTTKPVGEGTGLGLPLVYSLVQDHGGKVNIMAAPERGPEHNQEHKQERATAPSGHGTIVDVELPLYQGDTL